MSRSGSKAGEGEGEGTTGANLAGVHRARAMAERIAAAARRLGFDDDAALRASTLFDRVIEYRSAAVADEHDPDFLHPGRTAIILLEDLGTLDYACVAAGTALDSLQPSLTPDAGTLMAWGEHGAVRVLGEIPLDADDDDDGLTEALVTASPAARTVALAERLDHARHLHLRDTAQWSPFHQSVARLYLPLAARTNATLERRYQWWTQMFSKRFLSA